jgi:uncharacterized protein (TIGR00661 family)
MNILFATCTEGSGHCVQSIALKQYALDKGHSICCALAAKKKRGLPKFFTDEFEVVEFSGFDFVFDSKGRVIIWKTMALNILALPMLIYSFFKICSIIKKKKPEAIFNFYEPLVGLSSLFFPNIKYFSFGHQYAMTEPIYPKIKGFGLQKLFLYIINYTTSIKAKKFALSYYKFNSEKVIPCPPILRKESYEKSDKKENFILVYLMNEDLIPFLIEEAVKHPEEKIECFTKLTKSFDVPKNLILNNLNGKVFQEKMKSCKAVICSGGFETTAEAILNNKPVLMVPLENHFEQASNCNDATFHGLASANHKINLDLIPSHIICNDNWFNQTKEILDKNLI